jgi:homopolymeric O-antigen transport system ATP-binding protein
MRPIITVENLGKRYRLGTQGAAYSTLRESLTNAVLRRGKSMKRNGEASPQTLWALREINFEVKPGGVVGIIGRNGAGKSTLLKVLSRITEPTTGRVELRGRVGSLLEVGTGFHPELTGRENIFLNGSILGMTRREIKQKFDEIVSFAEIEKFLDTPVKRYSSGMYVRLAFAVAAHLEPEILVVDEVLAVGDLAFQQKCLNKMHDVSTLGRTVLFVSHNLGAVNRLCERSILLEKGRIIEAGPTQEVVRAYIAGGMVDQAEYLQEPNLEKDVHLRRVALLNPDNEVSSEIGYSEGLKFEVEYQVNRQAAGVSLGLAIFCFDGTCVFTTADFDTQPELLLSRAPGFYRTNVEIPSHWLNVGGYSVMVYVANASTVFDRVEALRFNVIDTGTPGSVNGVQRRGVLQPILGWKTEQMVG